MATQGITPDDLELIAICLKGTVGAMQMSQTSKLVELEQTEGFKELTYHTLGEIMSNLQEYIGCLNQVVEEKRNPPTNDDFNAALNSVFPGFGYF